MNCRPGDLALVIAGPHTGVMLTCIRLASRGELIPTSGGVVIITDSRPAWITDRRLWTIAGNGERVEIAAMVDEELLPIRPRDDDALEETAPADCEVEC